MSDTIHDIKDPERLRVVRECLSDASVIGLDTESDSMHCYFEKVCYIQIRAGKDVFLIDTLAVRDLESLQDIFADPTKTFILHGADYDVVCMERDFGVRFGGLFDTMIAAQYLGKQRLGLAALCEEYFGVELDKSLTKHNWGRRPLEDKYVRYLVEDVAHLDGLYRILISELEALDRIDEARAEFGRVSGLHWARRDFDPDGFHKIREGRSLPTPTRCLLKSIYAARDVVSRDLDLPPFKVLSNQAMVAMAQNPPASVSVLRRLWRGPRRLTGRHWEAMFKAIQQALAGDVVLGSPRKRAPRRAAATVRLEQELKNWRQKAATDRDCPTMVVLPNHALQHIADLQPSNEDELSEVPHMGRRRRERYGQSILEIVDANL